MTKSMLPSPENQDFCSVSWHESAVREGVRFAVRRISLSQRIQLTKQVRELTLQNEFLRTGSAPDKLEAALGDLLARRLYIHWGLTEIHGLTIDGIVATPETLVEHGPEQLAEEIADEVLKELQLTDDEAKNS